MTKDTIINKAIELKNRKYSIVSALVTLFTMFFAGIRTVECYDSFFAVAEKVFGVKVGEEHLEHDGLIISVGNDKIGKDTLICDVSCALDCFCRLNGMCNICNECYAVALESFRYPKLLKNVLSARRWLSTSYKEKIASFEWYIDDSIKYIRFNAYGDFYDLESLKTAFRIATEMYSKYGIITYFYTHNKQLEQYIVDNYSEWDYFVCNFSYPVPNQKETMAIEPKDIKLYAENDDFIICDGECYNCPYCKQKWLNKTIVFVKHGRGDSATKLVRKALGKEKFEELQNQKLLSYVIWRNSLQ